MKKDLILNVVLPISILLIVVVGALFWINNSTLVEVENKALEAAAIRQLETRGSISYVYDRTIESKPIDIIIYTPDLLTLSQQELKNLLYLSNSYNIIVLKE